MRTSLVSQFSVGDLVCFLSSDARLKWARIVEIVMSAKASDSYTITYKLKIEHMELPPPEMGSGYGTTMNEEELIKKVMAVNGWLADQALMAVKAMENNRPFDLGEKEER